jgi:hypothetical protein
LCACEREGGRREEERERDQDFCDRKKILGDLHDIQVTWCPHEKHWAGKVSSVGLCPEDGLKSTAHTRTVAQSEATVVDSGFCGMKFVGLPHSLLHSEHRSSADSFPKATCQEDPSDAVQ